MENCALGHNVKYVRKKIRDAPIIGWLLCRYRPIVIYYVLWWRWIQKLYYIIFF